MNWEEIGKNLLNFLKELLTTAGLRILYAVLIIVIGLKLIKFFAKRCEKAKWYRKIDKSVAHFIVSSLNVILKVLVFVSAALVLGVPATSFVAILTSAGVAIGLALQGSLSNFAGGLMILIFKPFRVGDYIESAEVSGTVSDISIFYTVLITPDNKTIHCPNGALSNTHVTNYSEQATRRVDIPVSVSYDADVATVKQLLTETAAANALVLPDTPPFVRLTECADSSLDFTVRVWCNTSDYWTVKFDLTEAIQSALTEAGIEIPYPQMDIHLKEPAKPEE